MIHITETAAAKFAKMAKEEDVGFRMSLVKYGCTGYAYKIEPESTITEDDHMFQSFEMIDKGIALVVSDEFLSKLDGMTIDYAKQGLNEGFEYVNPNTDANCGCGASVHFK